MEQAVPPPPPIPTRWPEQASGSFCPKEWTMARYKSVCHLLPTDAAYIAGLIDGEGTVTLTQEHRNENRRLVVSVSNNELEILTYLRHTIGAGRITNKRTYRSEHSPSYAYKIINRQALALLEQIAPFLRSYKSERASLILNHYTNLTPRNGKYSTEAKIAREQFEQTLLKLKPAIRTLA
jgi:hypothetical protein